MASEKRLIDANALLSELNEELEFETSMYTAEQNKWINTGLKIAVRDVKSQPTVDAVEVVRCKECKWRCNGKDCDHPLLLSWSWGAIRNVKDDDFCSYGERKDNG